MKLLVFASLMICLLGMAKADSTAQLSFEQNYYALQNKIKSLEQKGQKLNKETQKEINDLMIQMNHQHAKLKHQLERQNSSLQNTISKSRETIEEDWSTRVSRAFSALESGFNRAWTELKTDPLGKTDSVAPKSQPVEQEN